MACASFGWFATAADLTFGLIVGFIAVFIIITEA